MNEDLIFFSNIILDTYGVYMWQYTEDFDLLSSNCPDAAVLKNLFLMNSTHELLRAYLAQKDVPAMLADDLGFMWLIIPAFQKTGSAQSDAAHRVFVLGPVFTTDTSEQKLRDRMNIQEMPLRSQYHLIKLIEKIPVIAGNQFNPLGCMLYYALTGKHFDAFRYEFISSAPERPTPDKFNRNFSTASHHGSYALEQTLLQNVTDGNIYYREENERTKRREHHAVGTLAPGDPIRQAKDEIIVYIALVERAACRGGLSQEISFTLGDYYAQQVEQTTTVNEIYQLSQIMYDDFVNRVHDLKEEQKTQYSEPVRTCISLLNTHVCDKLSLSEIASTMGYSKYYLSTLFQKETGTSISEYSKKLKIEFAKHQLLDPQIDIKTISQDLNFSTPSYFSAVFRDITGMTPKEYRKKNAK